ncbi:2,3-bisphosphoglycerate-independent phosphoglycerate mutase [uncultured Campylobacter sp.]|uniref:2,3-bisphosphoglycerate-independent phosphoglycerate mutase n=1 Tax=uncultured Campylobacter sp. TaxID=218934 RepID=UPI00260D36CC|nr:2,3-bisphosphoglycerate-independent phosphoglycerate mutase [uncultured Campylobacter sp.]
MKRKCLLVITDGIGYNPSKKFNAFYEANKPNYEKLFKEVPNTVLKTSGLAVGLPEGQMGNSEVGHMCIGSGRIIYQNLVRINKAIEENTLKDNENLKSFLKKHKNIHIIGLYSNGGVHSDLNHFKAIAKIAKDSDKNVFLHAITDGRDVIPTSGLDFIKDLENFCDKEDMEFATICGRFYAMDRDKRWERLKEYYECLLAKSKEVKSFSEYIKQSYDEGVFDEFIKAAKSPKFSGFNEDDGIILINFRNDRMKQLVTVLQDSNFSEFKRDKLCKNILTMTVYDDKFKLPVIFEKEDIKNTLAEVISNENLKQFHTAETEKYAHVTFFFNGGKEDEFKGESRVLIPSPKVKTYDEKPEMSAFEVLETTKKAIQDGYDFIVVNFANGDMVGHTGNFSACVKAVEAVDKCLGELVDEARKYGYAFIITSDHGNCEAMKDEKGNLLTNHTTFDVFVFIEAKGVSKIKENLGLSNIAATVLDIMQIKKPKEMNESLI